MPTPSPGFNLSVQASCPHPRHAVHWGMLCRRTLGLRVAASFPTAWGWRDLAGALSQLAAPALGVRATLSAPHTPRVNRRQAGAVCSGPQTPKGALPLEYCTDLHACAKPLALATPWTEGWSCLLPSTPSSALPPLCQASGDEDSMWCPLTRSVLCSLSQPLSRACCHGTHETPRCL